MGAFPRRAPARSAGLAAPSAGPAASATSAIAAHPGGSPAVGVAVSGLERLANRARDRQTGDRHRLASPRLPVVLGVQEPPTHRSTDRASRRARTNSDDVGDEPVLGRASDSRRAAQTRD